MVTVQHPREQRLVLFGVFWPSVHGRIGTNGCAHASATLSSGGGIDIGGSSATAIITDSTISDNSAYTGGGIDANALSANDAVLNASGCTISGNSAEGGGGIYGRGRVVITAQAKQITPPIVAPVGCFVGAWGSFGKRRQVMS